MKNKIYSIQVLRAVAITLIFLSHCDNLVCVNDTNCLIYLGAAGVSIFIALSGFLCARQYCGMETVSAFEIYKKRWKQFYKGHFITLIIALPLSIGVLKGSPIKWVIELIANVTLTQSLIPTPAVYFSFNAVSWYLSLVCCFALLTPTAVKIWDHLSLKSTIALSVILNLIEFLIVIVGTGHSFIHWLAYIFPMARFLDFIIGGYLETWRIYQGERFIRLQQVTIWNWLHDDDRANGCILLYGK